MISAARQIKVGDPMDFASTMGPLISERQLANTERYVAAGRDFRSGNGGCSLSKSVPRKVIADFKLC